MKNMKRRFARRGDEGEEGERPMTSGKSFVDDDGPEFGSPEGLAGQDELSEADEANERLKAEERLQDLGASISAKFKDCERRRQPIEERWLEDLRQYHGRYDPGVESDLIKSESCALFLNITKPKTHAFSARVMDMVLPTDEKNWGLDPSPVPEMAALGGSEQPVPDPATGQPMMEPQTGQPVLAKDLAAGLEDEAKDRAGLMEEEINDQLSECEWNSIQRQAIEQMSKLGTGVILGPVIVDEWLAKWEPSTDGLGKTQYARKMVPNDARRPAAQWVDCWNFYPDMSTPNPKDWGHAFVQYLVNTATLRRMGKRFNFMKEPLERALSGKGFDVRNIPWMQELRQLSDNQNFTDERWRLLRYYGEIEREDLEAVGIDADTLGVTDTVYGVVWMCDGIVLKVDINQLDSGALPFSVCYCDKDEASPFGSGIPRLMRGEQESVNGAWRMKHDNAGLSVSPQTVMRYNGVVPADGDYHMKPKKIWYAADDVTRVQDVFAQFSIDSHQAELDNLLQLAIRFADDVTQLPLLMQGDQAPHITQTAQGMSLLYNASTVVLRRSVKFFDDYMTIPTISRFFDWNMQFNPREEIKGDMRVIARGSSTLLEKEEQGKSLDIAMQFASSPVWQPYTDMKKLYQQALKSKRIQDIMLSDDEIEKNLQAQSEQAAQMAQAGQKPAAAGPDPMVEAAKMALEEKKLALKQYEVDSRERIAVANYAVAKDVSLLEAQTAIAAIKIREDAANVRFMEEINVKQRIGTGI